MTLAPDIPTWTLTAHARAQLDECGIALSELYRLMRSPSISMSCPDPAERRVNGFGLTTVVSGTTILSVEIDGATTVNWREWAAERAAFGDGDVAGADELVKQDALRLRREQEFMPRQRRRKERAVAIETSHVLDRVHPALRQEISRRVEGDFSRLVIHSPTKVTIQPAR
jgi:hypothetical protein